MARTFTDAEKNIKSLLYPTDWLPTGNDVQRHLVDEFVASIENVLGMKVTKISLVEKWKETAPEEVRGINLPDYLRTVSLSQTIIQILSNTRQSGWRVNMWGGYHNFAEYRELHQKKFGRPPYTSPYQKWKW